VLVECISLAALTTGHDVALCAQLRSDEGVGRGHAGGVRYMYMYKYTDQEKWTVNHITYIVVYIEQCSIKSGITGIMFLFTV